ncbi:MAG: AsmA-like C-terminal region-containing protein, partial [Parvibaculaceae bacterium]
EIVNRVAGSFVLRNGNVERATLNGTFFSGQPITIRINPADDGGRDLRIAGRDAGSALRAANLYSKVAGGQIDFAARLGAGADATVRNGRLTLRDFEVRDEAALAELDQKGKPKKAGPRKGGVVFSRLTLPFTSDARFIRIGDTLVKGPELGATAQGLIRKMDGAIDIDGTIIPAYALNSAIGEVPILGDILTGGKGEGIFGLTYALGGTMSRPRFQVNPVSAIAPGILRKFFEYGGSGNGQPTRRRERNN